MTRRLPFLAGLATLFVVSGCGKSPAVLPPTPAPTAEARPVADPLAQQRELEARRAELERLREMRMERERADQQERERLAATVYFGFDSFKVDEEGVRAIEEKARIMQERPELRIGIEGHADTRGSREYNLALGQRRATAVKDALIGLGIDSSRISTVSYGKERPATPGTTEADHARNRRGEIRILNVGEGR